MKRYFIKLAAFLLALALPFVALMGLAAFTPDTKRTDGMAYSLHYKVDLLQQTPSPRIIFAGGSASENGIVCAQVAEAAHRPAICIGVTAYLGLDIYLSLLERYAVPGDTVVLMLENMLLRGDCTNYELLWQAAGGDADVWAAMPPSLWPGLAMNAWRYYRGKVPDGWSLWRDGLQWPDYSAASRPENLPAGFGPLGDVVAARPESLLASGYNTEDPIALYGGAADAGALRQLHGFAARMARRGVQVLFAYAPLDRLCVTTTAEENAAFAAQVEAGLALPVLVTLEQAMMDAPYFYDTNNHLTTPGAERYTAMLVERLLPLLAEG